MRNLRKNTRKLWYSNYSKKNPILDENGDETGDYSNGYSRPVSFYATLSASKGTAYADMFGTNLDYSRTLSTIANLPITEESLIWVSKPILNKDGTPNEKTADYNIVSIADGLNGLVVALKVRRKNA